MKAREATVVQKQQWLGALKEVSADAALASVKSELESVSSLKEEQRSFFFSMEKKLSLLGLLRHMIC